MPPDEEIQKPAPRPKRRLVPDLGSSPIEVGGQTLTRVARAPATADSSEGTLSDLDALARKHLGPHAEEVLAEHGDFLQMLSSEEEPSPGVADLAGRLELFSDTGVVPNPETAPDKRDGGQVSALVGTDDAPDLLLGRSQPETLLDLFEMFPQLDGVNWFIHVERKTPTLHGGVPCRGVLRRITHPMTDSEWKYMYGGGEYRLIVYGPPKRATVMNADGRVSPKKMTEPIVVRYPGPPSFESMNYDESDEDPSMTQGIDFTNRSRPMTSGDASVASKQIDVSADREKRLEEKAERARTEAERVRRDREQDGTRVMDQFMEFQREAADREGKLREQMLEREREVAAERRAVDEKWEERFRRIEGAKKPDEVERLVALATTMNKDGGSSLEALREEHAREIARLSEHRTSLETSHQRALKDERERADRLIQDERARADQRIKDAEERFHQSERDLRDRTDRELARVKEEADRRVSDMDRQHNNRMADLERTQTRDLAAKDAAHQMQIQTLESTWTMRLETAKGDTKRAQTDAERFRSEADANKDVVGKIKKMREDAAELGMVDPSEIEQASAEPETLPQMLTKVGGALLGNLPGMIENFATLARGKNQQELEQARALGRQEMVLASQQQASGVQPLPGPGARRPPRLPPPRLQPIDAVSPAPLIPGHEPTRRPTRAERIEPIPGTALQPEEILRREEEERQMRASAPPMMAPAQAPLAVSQFPVAIQPSVPPPAPELLAPDPSQIDPAAYEASTRQRAEDLEIVQTEQFLLPNYHAGLTPEMIVGEFAKLYPLEQIAMIVQNLGSADRVISAYERTRDPSHPFLMREGKKFLRGIFAALEKVAKGK